MSDLYEAVLRSKGEQVVGRVDPRRDLLAHSYVREVRDVRPRPLRELHPEPDAGANFIAGCAFLLGAFIVAVTLWALLALWLVR